MLQSLLGLAGRQARLGSLQAGLCIGGGHGVPHAVGSPSIAQIGCAGVSHNTDCWALAGPRQVGLWTLIWIGSEAGGVPACMAGTSLRLASLAWPARPKDRFILGSPSAQFAPSPQGVT